MHPLEITNYSMVSQIELGCSIVDGSDPSPCPTHSPCTMPWLAMTMMAVRAMLKVAFWPKLSRERLVVVFRAPCSYLARILSNSSASYFSLLKY